VTMQWDKGNPLSGHAMVLAAYDPNHVDPDLGIEKPWGFINSHGAHATLKWFSDAEFQELWNANLAVIGSNNIVVVTLDPWTTPPDWSY
jgi:hypothetical protein